MQKDEKWANITGLNLISTVKAGDRVKVVVTGEINMTALNIKVGKSYKNDYPKPADIKKIERCIKSLNDVYASRYRIYVDIYKTV